MREVQLLATSWVQFNLARPPFDNVLFRRALARAVDREAYVRDVAGGLGVPAAELIPGGVLGHDPGLGHDISFDPSAARALLAQAGFPDARLVPRVTLRYAGVTPVQRRAEFLQAQLRQNLGVQVELDPVETKAFLALYRSKNFDLTLGGWAADYGDPQNWLGTNFGCSGGNNVFNYCNEQLDRIVASADAAIAQDERHELYVQAQRILEQDVVGIWLLHPGRIVLVRPYVQDLTITPVDEYPGARHLDRVWIAPH
jgi:ABC-type oligopeptide transport system substrate-binding subunit